MQLQQVNDAVGYFGGSVAVVRKKLVLQIKSDEGERGSSETAKREQRSQDMKEYQ